jgi:hypothetical protein
MAECFYCNFLGRLFPARVLWFRAVDHCPEFVFFCIGEHTKKGFYAYDDKRKNKPHPELQAYVKISRKAAGLMPDGKVGPPSSLMP